METNYPKYSRKVGELGLSIPKSCQQNSAPKSSFAVNSNIPVVRYGRSQGGLHQNGGNFQKILMGRGTTEEKVGSYVLTGIDKEKVGRRARLTRPLHLKSNYGDKTLVEMDRGRRGSMETNLDKKV